ncbi:hypothetical protein TTE2036 [Caldanaerobacter subterraneus subsp. tengcongensis MB4]|uniref:Uncharacterized protein n=1 Tax=Caldanaerobacter subterraneus subsp. tengcongensis (strain DSM 15242 / JCM 11007 / NBRC 100824 / MB4) TaxID=273068 RepID=Q8R8G3_CALS4|nr:hypothetical protein TTE2036 [Caldanaerobacter subterraneus subsp. tengcongensis MB4]
MQERVKKGLLGETHGTIPSAVKSGIKKCLKRTEPFSVRFFNIKIKKRRNMYAN